MISTIVRVDNTLQPGNDKTTKDASVIKNGKVLKLQQEIDNPEEPKPGLKHVKKTSKTRLGR